jgi:hypothetical protein
MHPHEITPDYLMCRDAAGKAIPLYARLPTVSPGALLNGISEQNNLPPEYGLYWNRALTNKFGLAPKI